MSKRNLFLMDDIEDLVEMLEDQLSDHFNVSSFVHYKDADKYISEHKDELDIVVCDFKMPDKNGIQVLNQIKEANPNTVRILFTGYADSQEIVANKDAYHSIMDKNDYRDEDDLIGLINQLSA